MESQAANGSSQSRHPPEVPNPPWEQSHRKTLSFQGSLPHYLCMTWFPQSGNTRVMSKWINNSEQLK